MNADHIAAALLIWAAVAWLVVGMFRAVREPEPRSLPGALGSSPWPQVDAWEEHVRTTPGLVDGAIEACDMALWEIEMGADA